MQTYHYIGPDGIRDQTRGDPPGALIRSPGDLERWLADDDGNSATGDGAVTATFVVDTEGCLRIVSRHAEHVACAGGGPVLSAGEMTFEPEAGSWYVSEVSNLSTGFCPEPDSWPAVAAALDHAAIPHPDHFTDTFVFRLCTRCGERNLVKDEWFVCALCDAALPQEWNFR